MSIIEDIMNNFEDLPELMEIIPDIQEIPDAPKAALSPKFRLSDDGSRYTMLSDGKEITLTDPINHNHSIEDIKEVVLMNDIPCYVYQNGEGKYSLRPAVNGSPMAIDAYCYDIDSWGKYGDFEKIKCHCGYKWYKNVRQIPQGDMYEAMCHKCGAHLKRKRI